MASGKGLRAKWTGKMAAAIGWNRGRLAHILAHNGLKAPYRKAELKAMQILKGYGLSLAKYTPTEDAVGMEVVPAVVKRLRGFEIVSAPTATVTRKKKGMMPSKNGDGGDASAPPEDDKKKHGSWSDRLLVSRLAKLLPEDATTSGKNRARYILLKAGYPKIKDVDEAKALEVFKQAGIDITNFEFASAPGEPGGLLVAPPAREYDSLLMQYTSMGERLTKSLDDVAARDATIKKMRSVLELARQGLLSYQKLMLGTPSKPGLAATKYGGLPKPLNYPIDVLAELSEFTE